VRKEIEFTLAFFFAVALLMAPVSPWVYQDNSLSDTRFERFGPRADRLLIKLYSNETAEWDALARGEIDITDWYLSKTYYDLFTSNAINPSTGLPYNETINTVSYGAEFGIYLLDINNNNNEFLGNPPDPAYPNPVYPNPGSVKEFRQAIAHLVDRSQLDSMIGEGFYVPLYTLIPPSSGGYAHSEIRPGGSLENLTYPYSRAAAETLLDANGFPVNASTGWRYWDRNHNNIEDSDEYLELKFFIRYDDAKRLAFGNFLADELNSVKVRVTRIYNIIRPPNDPMVKKDFHLYTGGWTLGIDPDHLILWNWDYYWHPGFCYNYAGINNADYNVYSDAVMNAKTLEEVKTNAWLAQEVFASEALSVPLWSRAGSKAMSRVYTGGNTWQPITPDDGENTYRGRYWEGAVNRPAFGINDFFSFLNMHPAGYERGDGENMTIRWGFKTDTLTSFNPIFATWFWDWNVLGLIYESLIVRNPYDNAEFIPWLAESFEVGTYNHPAYGESAKVRVTLRSEATWHDGTPITAADVYFTWVELWNILERRGYPWPIWGNWHGRGGWNQPMVDMKILDPYNFEMLFDFGSAITALSWLSGEVILPKHVWKPIAETGSFDALDDPAADPNMIGSGPWRFKEYVAGSHVLLVANSPGSTVQTSHSGSIPVTSPKGYWRYTPLNVECKIDGSTISKVPYSESHTVNFTLNNLYYAGPLTIDVFSRVTYQNGTVVEEVQTDITLNTAEQPESSWTLSHSSVMTHKVRFDINVFIKSPSALGGWLNVTRLLWVTLVRPPYCWSRWTSDVAGSTFYDDLGLGIYPYKWELPTSDFKVDIKDIAALAKAFGTYPGHSRWSPIGDMNNDYKIDIRDIASVASTFGWEEPP